MWVCGCKCEPTVSVNRATAVMCVCGRCQHCWSWTAQLPWRAVVVRVGDNAAGVPLLLPVMSCLWTLHSNWLSPMLLSYACSVIFEVLLIYYDFICSFELKLLLQLKANRRMRFDEVVLTVTGNSTWIWRVFLLWYYVSWFIERRISYTFAVCAFFLHF